MDYSDRKVSLSTIDAADRTYRITTGEDIAPLTDAIGALGLIHPPILTEDRDRYAIVSGFRRVAACRALGWTDVMARVVGGGTRSLDCASIAIADNSLQRSLNLIETSRAICLLDPFFPDAARLCEFASILGMPGSPAIFGKLERLCRMPSSLQRGILSESISLAMALELDGYEEAVGIAFALLFQNLRLSLNKQRELVTWVREISLREDMPIMQLLESPDIRTILRDADLDGNQKVARLRSYLRKRRFPSLTADEKTFEENTKAMKTGEGMRLIPPRDFEGTTYSLQVHFKSLDELKARHTSLGNLIKHPNLKVILGR